MKSYHEIVGDGGSRVLEQVAERRRRVEENLRGVRAVLAVGSGKGGVGKSTLTLWLAATIRARGRATAILDADLNGPTQSRMAGLGQAPPLPGPRGLALPRNAAGIGVVSMGSIVPEHEALEFESVASGESHTWRAVREFTLFGDLLASVEWGDLDLLLIDLPPGAERTVQYAEQLGPAAAFALVTVPSDVSRGVVARSAAALARMPNRVLGYVENMSGYWCAACGELRPLFPAGSALDLGLPLLGRLPFDPHLAAAGDRGDCNLDDIHPAVRDALEACASGVLAALES